MFFNGTLFTLVSAYLQETTPPKLSGAEIAGILAAITTLANVVFMGWQSFKKGKPEVKKLESEAESELQEATNLNLEGAKRSGEILLDRNKELKDEIKAVKEECAVALKAERDARLADAEYFRRRIKELDREASSYRLWAAQLVKQLVEAGKIPIPFTPIVSDTEQGIPALKKDK